MPLDYWSLDPHTCDTAGPLQDWLLRPSVLSRAFQSHSPVPIRVQLLNAQSAFPFSDENDAFSSLASTFEPGLSWIRQVYLVSGDTPWSYGRVVAPPMTYAKHQQVLDTLGNRFIGETLLYGRTDVTRSPFSYMRASKGSIWYQAATAGLLVPLVEPYLWGRRSVFWIGADPILISEFFFPMLPQYRP